MKMKVPAGMTGISYDGVEYVAEDGHVLVPAEAAAELISHGLEPVAGSTNDDLRVEQDNTTRKATRGRKESAE